jgi:hypothetical protein
MIGQAMFDIRYTTRPIRNTLMIYPGGGNVSCHTQVCKFDAGSPGSVYSAFVGYQQIASKPRVWDGSDYVTSIPLPEVTVATIASAPTVLFLDKAKNIQHVSLHNLADSTVSVVVNFW